jgi:hypothetical protein
MCNEAINEDSVLRVENLDYIIVCANIPASAISKDLPATMRAFVYKFTIELPQDLIPAAVSGDCTAATTNITIDQEPKDWSQSPKTMCMLMIPYFLPLCLPICLLQPQHLGL